MDKKLASSGAHAERIRALIDWLLLIPASIILIVVESYQPIVSVALVLIAIFFILSGIQGRLIRRRTGLEIPLFLFVISAGLAVYISYNQSLALLQFTRLLAAVALYFAIAESIDPFPELVAVGFLTLTAGLAIFWSLNHDYTLEPGKLALITGTGRWINAHFSAPPGPVIHKNAAGATLLLAVPFGLALTWQAWTRRRLVFVVVFLVLSSIVLFGLLMTSSVGSWVGLFTMIFVTALSIIQRRWFRQKTQKIIFWSAILLILIALLLGLQATIGVQNLIGMIPDSAGSLVSRIDFWKDGLSLINDYGFTGSGLQTYLMVQAVYARMTNDPYIPSSHNSFLQVWIEQGFWGALALIWGTVVIAGWAWKSLDRSDTPILGWAGLAALFAAGVHGIVDVVYYNGQTLPILGLPLGFAALAYSVSASDPVARATSRRSIWIVVGGAIILLTLGMIFRNSLIGAWYANIGALEQTRQELGRYDPVHHNDLPLETVRKEADLSVAEKNFSQALSYRPSNRTALQRLAMIAIARQDYPQALSRIETAWQAGHRDLVTRLNYSDALVASGKLEEAADLVEEYSWAEQRIFAQAWYRYWLGEDYQRAAYAWQTVLILNPQHQEAAAWLQKAQKSINP